jgi:hypothetical protein
MQWLYQNNIVDSLPEGAIGFVYIIHYKDGRAYVGKKLAVSKTRLKPLKTQRKNAVRTKVAENKWKSYTGSSKLTEGLEIETKEILAWCSNQRTMTYLENKYLFGYGVLESCAYLNENIGGKFWSNCLDGLILQ